MYFYLSLYQEKDYHDVEDNIIAAEAWDNYK